MWPFKRKKTLVDRIEVDTLEVEALITEKWLTFSQLKFKDEVPLSFQLKHFSPLALEAITAAKPHFIKYPSELIMLTFLNGIVRAGTHSALELQDALGIPRSS